MMKSFSAQLWRFLPLLLGALLSAHLTGCATTASYEPDEAPEMMVISDFAPFYTLGPMQGRGPDASLRIDSRVLLLRREFGFSLVRLENGRQGYVPNEVLAVAPPRPTPEAVRADTGASTGAAPRRTPRQSESFPEPRFDDISLPDLDIIPLEVPPPILLDDEETRTPPPFRL